MATQGFGCSRDASPRRCGAAWWLRARLALLACSTAWIAIACEGSSSSAGGALGGQSSATGGVTSGGASHNGGTNLTGGSHTGGASTAGGGANAGADTGVSGGGSSSEITDGGLGGGAGAGQSGSAGAGEAGDGGAGANRIPTLQSAQMQYPNWHRATEEPQSISSAIFALCRLPSMAEQAFVESEHGDHLYLLDWLNEEAYAGAAVRESQPFPPGAAIVKEKLRWDGDAGFKLAALGFMIKHEPGYDSQHGDWEFGYWQSGSDAPQSDAETATYCGGCHATSPTDFAFLDQRWRQ